MAHYKPQSLLSLDGSRIRSPHLYFGHNPAPSSLLSDAIGNPEPHSLQAAFYSLWNVMAILV